MHRLTTCVVGIARMNGIIRTITDATGATLLMMMVALECASPPREFGVVACCPTQGRNTIVVYMKSSREINADLVGDKKKAWT